MLPPLLDFAAARRPVARALGATLGERGTWLAGLNEAWGELVAEGPAPRVAGTTGEWTEVWPTLPTAEAVPAFATGRREDPRVACDLLEAHWDTLPAKSPIRPGRSWRECPAKTRSDWPKNVNDSSPYPSVTRASSIQPRRERIGRRFAVFTLASTVTCSSIRRASKSVSSPRLA